MELADCGLEWIPKLSFSLFGGVEQRAEGIQQFTSQPADISNTAQQDLGQNLAENDYGKFYN